MYYKFQKLKPSGSGEFCEHWEDIGESHKVDDVKTIFQKWRDLILYFKDSERIFTWDFGKDESLLFAIDDKIITVWVYEKKWEDNPTWRKENRRCGCVRFLNAIRKLAKHFRYYKTFKLRKEKKYE